MSKHFVQLTAEEQATIRVMAQEGKSLRAMAKTRPCLHRRPSTISREWRRQETSAAMPLDGGVTMPSRLATKRGGSGEHPHGLLRQYLPKGIDLALYNQDQIDGRSLESNATPLHL